MQRIHFNLLLLVVGFYACTDLSANVQKESGMFSARPAARWQDILGSGNGEIGILAFFNMDKIRKRNMGRANSNQNIKNN